MIKPKNIFAVLGLFALLLSPLSFCAMTSEIGGLNNSIQNIDNIQKTPEDPEKAACCEGLPVVVTNTAYGQVAGLKSDDGLNVFLGVPYATPPMGDLRFRPPQEPASWKGILPAFSYGSVCPQTQAGSEAASYYPQSEDCLSLNIWTPGIDDKHRPVVVFIHGGAFIEGASANPMYNGSSLASNGDIVVVTINYRLGALGFLYLEPLGEEYAESGNLGILDQIHALQWVKNNIEMFGGDPKNVTLMGQSAGSISVTTLMSVPQAKGLFRRAIAESGAPNLCLSRENAANITRKFMKLANVTDVEGLRRLTAFQLIDVQGTLLKDAGLSASNTFAPVIDGQVLLDDPFLALNNGSAAGIPLLLGTNRNEFRLWLLLSPILADVPPIALLDIIPDVNGTFGSRWALARIIARYRLSQPLARPNDLTMDILTDAEFWIPQVRMAEVQSKHAPTWMYRFDWPSPFENGKLGACHALELPFIFHNFNSPATYQRVGPIPPMKLANKIQNTWIAFIRTGDPNTVDLPLWPGYNTSQRATMILNLNSALQDDPAREVRLFYKGTPMYPSNNESPNAPSKPSGSAKGYAGAAYRYTTSAIDPDKDQVKYTFDWGDGTKTDTNLVNSGTKSRATHAWSTAGTYQVKAMWPRTARELYRYILAIYPLR